MSTDTFPPFDGQFRISANHIAIFFQLDFNKAFSSKFVKKFK